VNPKIEEKIFIASKLFRTKFYPQYSKMSPTGASSLVRAKKARAKREAVILPPRPRPPLSTTACSSQVLNSLILQK
jgi:hypothetical protein